MGIRAALAVHPASGHGAAGRAAPAVTAALHAVVDHLTVVQADTIEESRALMVRARDAGLDLLVVLGGDGSVHQGMQFCVEHGVPLAVIPAGTGNDLARSVGLPGETMPATDEVVEAIRTGRRRTIDLGRIDGGDKDGTVFGTVLCAGFDSAVNERANAMRWPRGPRRYDLAILAELAALKSRPLVLRTEDDRLELDATLVAVANTPYYGGGIPVCPDADPTDGLLDVTVFGRVSRLDLIRLLPTLRTGRHVRHPAVTTLRAKSVRVGEDNGWIAYADGDRMCPLPAAITCAPGALTVVC